jgi:hypothetical protein
MALHGAFALTSVRFKSGAWRPHAAGRPAGGGAGASQAVRVTGSDCPHTTVRPSESSVHCPPAASQAAHAHPMIMIPAVPGAGGTPASAGVPAAAAAARTRILIDVRAHVPVKSALLIAFT